MAENSYNPAGETYLTAFITTNYYVVGAGETVHDIQSSGEWIATTEPVEVRR